MFNPQAYWWKVLANVAEFLHYVAIGRRGFRERVRTMSAVTAKNHHLLGPNSQALSFRKLDGRGVIARRMRAIRDDLADGLGGWDTLSPQQRIIIDIIAVRMVRCQMLTAAMLGDDGLSNEAERRLNWHLASVRRDLAVLGLEKRTPRGPTLQEHVAANYGSATA